MGPIIVLFSDWIHLFNSWVVVCSWQKLTWSDIDIYLNIIDDQTGQTIIRSNSLNINIARLNFYQHDNIDQPSFWYGLHTKIYGLIW